jgi:hypothetical protein
MSDGLGRTAGFDRKEIPIPTLAEELYNKSLALKKYSASDLLYERKRTVLLNDLQTNQQIVFRILGALKDDMSYSSEYYDLAVFMCRSLFECTYYLASKKKNYRRTVWRYVHGFHNLPRAFLPLDSRARVSVKDAMNYYASYMNAE